jgi:anaerobic selenocysteine-containing dehydrogenase
LVFDVDESSDKIVKIWGGHDHSMTKGFACIKGLEAGEIQQGKQRLKKPLERQPDGSFVEVKLEVALDRIAKRMQGILKKEGPNAIATFRGTQHYISSVALEMFTGFIKALATKSRFSTMISRPSGSMITVWDSGLLAGSVLKALMCGCLLATIPWSHYRGLTVFLS